MRRAAALAVLILTASCGRVATGDEPDAGADQRLRTAAKTTADLAAADRAARAPMPRFAAAPAARVIRPAPSPGREAETPEDLPEPADNAAD